MKIEININDNLVRFIKKVFTWKGAVIGLTLLLFIGGIFIFSEAITKPNEFHAGDLISANEMNENFDTLYDKVNDMDELIDTIVTEGGLNPWASSNGDLYYNSGNVGIGTSSPETLLHVNGTISTDGTGHGIRWKLFSGLTDPSGTTRIPHGLDASKILSICCNILTDSGAYSQMNFQIDRRILWNETRIILHHNSVIYDNHNYRCIAFYID